MPGWVRDSAVTTLTLVLLAGMGVLRFASERRFRVRGSLPVSPGFRRARRTFVAAVTITSIGFVALIGRLNGGPPALMQVGTPLSLAGLATLVASFVWLSRERFRSS